MKNSSLHILKAIFGFLLGWLLVLSCTKDDVNQDIPAGVPNPNASEIVVKLLIKGEAILPPSTRAMDESTEGTFQESLLLFILEKQGDKYVYNCHRSVKKGEAEGSFIVRVPSVLKGKDLKFLLFANSKNVIGENPDEKFLNQDENHIRKNLIQNMNQKWDNWRIPMWAEDTLSPFNAPADGAQSAAVANLKLVRMLARVDVGIGYPKEPNSKSTAAGLNNFKLKNVKVYHSKNRGQLIPNTDAYTMTGTGIDKIITIKSPSIPEGISNIPPYNIQVEDDNNACEREIYMFEQQIKDNSSSGFKKERTCILIEGEYTDTNGKKYTGWYRLDFRGFGDNADYTDVLRNKLYRFNIIEAKGSGYTSEEDALNSQASNITVNLQAMDLEQNDIIFDGQSFLSVNTSELLFYQNLNTANFTLSTNYGEGTTNNAAWKIKTDGTTGITASPNMGPAGNVVVSLTWDPLPSADEEQIVKLTAGNLEKTLLLKYIHDNTPGNLTSFSLEPPFLYFLKSGGTGEISVKSNIAKKYLSTTLGNLEFDVAPETTANSFDVRVKPFPKSGFTPGVEKGAVNVNVKAANAEVTATCVINQLTYDKDLTVPLIGTMVHGVGSNSSASLMNVPYTTGEGRGTYMISFKPVDGGYEIGPHLFNPDQVSGQGMVQITATPNKTSKERVVGKLQFKRAENGQEINLVGYTAKEFEIKQEPVPAPSVSIQPHNDVTELPWNQTRHSFTVSVDNIHFVENDRVTIAASKSRSIDMTVPPSGTLGTPIDLEIQPNRGDNPKSRTLSVEVNGYGDHVGREEITFTQKAPEGIKKEPVAKAIPELPWNATNANLSLSNLSNVYEVKATTQEAVNGSPMMTVNLGDKDFTMSSDKSSAELGITFDTNNGLQDRKVKVKAEAIGNRESEKKPVEFTLIQKTSDPGTISFGETTKRLSWRYDSKGSVAVNAERINANTIADVVITGEKNWLGLSYNSNAFAFSANTNASSQERSVVFKLGAQDVAGRQVMSSNTLTIIQEPASEGVFRFNSQEYMFGRDRKEHTFDMTITDMNMNNFSVSSGPSWIENIRIENNKVKGMIQGNAPGNVGPRTSQLSLTALNYRNEYITANVTVKKKGNLVKANNIDFQFSRDDQGFKETELLLPLDSRSLSNTPPAVTATDGNPNILESGPNFRILTERRVSMSYRLRSNNAYDPREVTYTLAWLNAEGEKSYSYITITQLGQGPVQYQDWGTIPSRVSAMTNGQSLRIDGKVMTTNLQPNTYIKVRMKTPVLGVKIKDVTELKTNNTLASKFGFTVEVAENGTELFIGSIEIIGEGVDGQVKVLKTIRFN